MPDSNGIFILDAGAPGKVDDIMMQRVHVMFVFEVDPVTIGTTRIKQTPANEDGHFLGEWLLGEAAEILLPLNASHIVDALNDGTAIYQMVGVTMAYPVEVTKELPALKEMWQKMHAAGQKTLVTDRFKFAGQWIEIEPPSDAG